MLLILTSSLFFACQIPEGKKEQTASDTESCCMTSAPSRFGQITGNDTSAAGDQEAYANIDGMVLIQGGVFTMGHGKASSPGLMSSPILM